MFKAKFYKPLKSNPNREHVHLILVGLHLEEAGDLRGELLPPETFV